MTAPWRPRPTAPLRGKKENGLRSQERDVRWAQYAPLRGRDAFRRFAPARGRFLRATDRCARPGSHVGQNGRPRYLWPREQVFHPPRLAFGIRALLIEDDFLPVVASA